MGLIGRRAALVATGLALLVPACGADDVPASSDPTTTTAATAPSTTAVPTEPPDPAVSGAPTVADGPIGGSRYLASTRPVTETTSEIVVEDRTTGEERVVVEGARDELGEPVVTADGATVAWAEGTAGDERVVIEGPAGALTVDDVRCPHWLPDGDLLVSTAVEEGRPARVDPATGTVEPLPVDLGGPVCAAPAGPGHLIFPRALGGETYGPEEAEIVRAALDGRTTEVVGHVPGLCWANDVRATPDGSRIAAGVLCDPDRGRAGIWVGTLDDDLAPLVAENPPRTFVPDGSQYWSPSWSADGSAIAYQRVDQTGPETADSHIWVVDVADGTTSLLDPGLAWAPALSPPVGGGRD